jgi:hypothetical protein
MINVEAKHKLQTIFYAPARTLEGGIALTSAEASGLPLPG